ncbi:hypothetical protein BJ742DRAFT_741856 [Cladochytrium replicatum]|nr:hypothetical protein BJ742DRAFT_741856 [Cladochytrium replicatum]
MHSDFCLHAFPSHYGSRELGLLHTDPDELLRDNNTPREVARSPVPSKIGQKQRAKRISVQLSNTTIDALLKTPLAKKRRVERDDIFVKNYCIRLASRRLSLITSMAIWGAQQHTERRVDIAPKDFEKIKLLEEHNNTFATAEDAQEDEEGQDEDGNEDGNSNEDGNEHNFKTLEVAMIQVVIYPKVNLMDQHSASDSTTKSSKKLDTLCSLVHLRSTHAPLHQPNDNTNQVHPPELKICPILSFTLKNLAIEGKQLIGLYMRYKKQHPEDDDLPIIKDMDSAELYEP